MIAGEEIPFGHPIRAVDGVWVCTTVGQMRAVAARPRWANQQKGSLPSHRTTWLPGEEVQIRLEGNCLMIVPERCHRGGGVILAGSTDYVTLSAGVAVGLEPF